jgi:drug/metabolite transporter (DMT)-like permease
MPQRRWPMQAGFAVLWGATLLGVRLVVAGFGWAPATVLTMLVVAATIAAATRLAGSHPRLGGPAVPLLLLSLGLAVENAGLCLAFDQLGIAPAVLVLAAMPLFATLTGQVWGIDRITGAAAAGLAVGFVGLLLVVAFPAAGDTWAFISGVLAALLSALAAAFVSRYATLRVAERPETAITAHLLAVVICVPLLFAFPGGGNGGAGGYAALLLVALGVVVLGPMVGVRPAGSPDAALLGPLKLAGMVLVLVAGIVLAGDRLSWGQVAGGVLIAVGTLLVTGLAPARLLPRWRG